MCAGSLQPVRGGRSRDRRSGQRGDQDCRAYVSSHEYSQASGNGDGHDRAHAAGRRGPCELVFVSGDLASSQIYLVDADGSNLKQLTDTQGHNREPSWSLDGSLIAFWSDRSGDHEIFVMNADGSNQVNLTNNPGSDENPTWLPEFSQR